MLFLKNTDLSNRHQRNTNMSIRSASHAGSWYENDGNRLGRELEEWLNSATAKVIDVKHSVYC